jgi:putative colanic acid biosynthesis acetyltransferase WcaF
MDTDQKGATVNGSRLASTRVRLDLFRPLSRSQRGRAFWIEGLWYLTKCLFFLSSLPWPNSLKVLLLRAFGARIGVGVRIKPRVNIHLPWNLAIGDHSWVGEEVTILNFEVVTIGSHCCISQQVYLCTGNHDYRDPAFAYRNAPIRLQDGVWLGALSFVAPGVNVGVDAVATAGSVVTTDLPAAMICSGNPCTPQRPRWSSEEARSSDPFPGSCV